MPYTYPRPRPSVTTDVALFRCADEALELLLIRRRDAPFAETWALPGGFVEKGETLEAAARRELAEEAGITGVALRQLAACGEPGRDPRGWTISIVFWGWHGGESDPTAGDDATKARWWPVDDLPALAFDHAKIIEDTLEIVTSNEVADP